MSMSDCIHCWETPCVCGYEYKDWNEIRKIQLIKAVAGKDILLLQEIIDDLDKENLPGEIQ